MLKMQTDTSLFVEAEAVPILAQLSVFFTSHDIECYLVGGYIRDGLLGKTSRDIDLAVNGDAIAIAKAVADFLQGSFVPLDEMHKVARVVLQRNGARWYLDFAAMKGSVETDLARRDFTINALATKLTSLQTGWNNVSLIDPFHGLQHLRTELVKAVSEATFSDDPGRLLRTSRMAAELGFSIDEDTEALVRGDRELIRDVSGERLRDEIGRVLETGRTADSLRHLDRVGLLDILIPELARCKGVEQPKEHFWNVFDHLLETVAAVECLLLASVRKGDLLDDLTYSIDMAKYLDGETAGGRTRKVTTKLAALFHDVAKPQAKQIDQNGRMRFLGHDKDGARIADSILERLRFSNKEKRMVTTMVRHHMRLGFLVNADELPTRRAIYRYFRDADDVGIDTLFLGLADHLATRGLELDMQHWREYVEGVKYILERRFKEESTVSPPKLLDGHDLMNEFGLTPGPRIGKLLEAVREAQAAGEVESKQQALNLVRKELDRGNATKR